MVFKPLDEKTYLRYLKAAGWSLKKGSIDHKLYDEKKPFCLCNQNKPWKKFKRRSRGNERPKNSQGI